ncbi:MAG: succinate--CoA ligase subunit alpha [Candidatus Helarchaeota archaeon]
MNGFFHKNIGTLGGIFIILINHETKTLIQGITGKEGRFHTEQMLNYGTNILAGVTPGKGGFKISRIPVFNKVNEALSVYPKINSSVIFVPAKFCKSAAMEAIQAGIKLIVIITEGLPLLDELNIITLAEKEGITIIGPNTAGVISPREKYKLGIMPAKFFHEGCIGICSRSGTLMYEIVINLKKFGISTAVGIGGDPVIGTNFVEILKLFEKDRHTKAVVLIGEIGGQMEEKAVDFIKKEMNKPVVGYVAGRNISIKNKRFGHAGALISSSGYGTAKSKIKKFESIGVKVAEIPSEIPKLIEKVI